MVVSDYLLSCSLQSRYCCGLYARRERPQPLQACHGPSSSYASIRLYNFKPAPDSLPRQEQKNRLAAASAIRSRSIRHHVSDKESRVVSSSRHPSLLVVSFSLRIGGVGIQYALISRLVGGRWCFFSAHMSILLEATPVSYVVGS